MNKRYRIFSLFITSILVLTMLSGCENTGSTSQEKTFNYGTMAYGVAMGNTGLNPHEGYSGWSTIRYGVGETLFKFNESMELEPWLATDYEQIDEYTVRINLREDVTFSNGNKMTGEAVKDCLENLIAVHDRAPSDLQIKSIEADGQSITITSNIKVPGFVNYLCDPYGAIIDMEAGVTEDKNVVGTGPYIATRVTDTEINLTSNDNYWDGEVIVNNINVKSITDGDTLTMALQSGDIDAAQGLPYVSLQLFQDDPDYTISSTNTSRLYQAALNFRSELIQDDAVREAMALSMDKEGFTSVLLQGNGSPAIGPYPANFTFGGDALKADEYDVEKAGEILENAGWIDSNGDGIREKDGKRLTIRWLTYTSRQELPLLAESVQATYKEAGIEVLVNATDNFRDFLQSGEYDVYASAFVSAPTGDPQYYFTTHVVDDSDYNRGHYHNDNVEKLVEQLRDEFDTEKRSELAVKIAQQVLDDRAYIYASHLKMSFVMREGVAGFIAHPSDYYEITSKLDIYK
ncbi:ABC transporter substrate-binding protein [Alkalibacter saccharofermentans]|uniref:Peptide/nickel transport system substrate-binding protein n=1 Tax=Alkalibacter saccharofermentans DSM 14828 TaxID=1120975 RepID=A0A1M4UR20_9FIRM|nr:ABC transporter substrate-binding protein [Alkalibacter saccharofermentans]SHE59191.1 peptide/nickel transport system substrate-binding protein [Alkalibacter saccharofermentans DSM 14828]